VPTDAHSEAVERPTAVTDTSVASYYSASFSPEAGFYLLSYEGPGVPFQKVIKVGDECRSNLISDAGILLMLGLPSERAVVGGQHGVEQDGAHV
jgi:dipeptidyl aminopeptidase